MFVYLCGPINNTQDCTTWRRRATDHIEYECGHSVLDPTRGKDPSEWEHNGLDAPNAVYSNGGFVLRDFLDIDRADLILFVWQGDPGRQSWGSAIEMGYAFKSNKPIIVVDLSADNSALCHPFINQVASACFTNLERCFDYLEWALDEEPDRDDY